MSLRSYGNACADILARDASWRSDKMLVALFGPDALSTRGWSAETPDEAAGEAEAARWNLNGSVA